MATSTSSVERTDQADNRDLSSSDEETERFFTGENPLDYLDLGENLGNLQPYRFEPYASSGSESQTDGSDGDSDDSNGDPEGRLNNTNWCQCGHCLSIPDVVQSVCCKEIQKLEDKMGDLQCITLHEGFAAVCLNRYALQVAYYGYHQDHGHYGDHGIHERYRYTAYRQFVRWHWGYLGRNIRVPLPSCIVNKIRDNFPSAEYGGFQYPPLDI